jgi:hypothetical protein
MNKENRMQAMNGYQNDNNAQAPAECATNQGKKAQSPKNKPE